VAFVALIYVQLFCHSIGKLAAISSSASGSKSIAQIRLLASTRQQHHCWPPRNHTNLQPPAFELAANRTAAQFATTTGGSSSVLWRDQRASGQQEPARFAWASAGAGQTASKLIPSARYVYGPPPPATIGGAADAKRNRILSLHSQLNQLKLKLEAELGDGDEQQQQAADADGRHPDAWTVAPQANELGGHAETTVSMVALGSPCLSSSFCSKSIKNSQCNLESFTCVCLGEHVRLNSTTCLARKCACRARGRTKSLIIIIRPPCPSRTDNRH
jgi:hypothetical protein